MQDKYVVLGNPIAHSRSPFIHSCFAQQTQQQLSYTAQLAPLDDFEGTIEKFFASLEAGGQGGKGANITVPFKLNALVYADQLAPRAKRAGAVNTLWLDKHNQVWGDNTDGVGLVTDLTANLGVNLQQARVLLVGAGGAARGVIEPLLNAGIARLVIANRTPEKAVQLVKIFHGLNLEASLEAHTWASLAGEQFDLIINATSASLAGELPPLPQGLGAPNCLAYDMMYAAKSTPFMDWAQRSGIKQQADGLGMLVEQAAEAFFIWRKVRPQTAPVLAQLRQALAQEIS